MFALIPAAASASDLLVDVSQGSDTGRQVSGPGTVTFLGINPLKETATFSAKLVISPPSPPANIPAVKTPSDIDDDIRAASSAIEAAKKAIVDASTAIDNQFAASISGSTTASDIPAIVTRINAAIATDEATFNALQKHALILSTDQAKFTPSAPQLSAISSDLQDIQALQNAYGVLSNKIGAANISGKKSDSCSGLQGGSSADTISVILTPITPPTLKSGPLVIPNTPPSAQTSSAIINCPGNIALSAGFIFSTLPNHSYSAIATNPIGAPMGAPAATVQQTSSPNILPTAFVSFAPWACGENCGFISFGTAVSSGTGSSATLNFSLGGTYSIYRYAYITVGTNLANVTNPAPGYSPGSGVAAGATIPTTTSSRLGFFLGISFGGSPGGTTQKASTAGQ